MLRSRVWGDCGFMAKVVDPDDSQVEVPLAHADMADIVEDALRFASPDQKVGASGVSKWSIQFLVFQAERYCCHPSFTFREKVTP